MAKFKSGDLRLKGGNKVSFNLALDSNLWWDDTAHELRLDTTISGVNPIQDYQLTTKWYVDDEIGTLSGSIVSDHGALSGLGDDDHPQYILVDGSRGFTSTVNGVTPIEDAHLTRKDYVDNQGATISGDIISYVDAQDTVLSGALQTNIDAIDGVTKDTITSSGILNFVGGDNITIIRSAEDEITISGTAGGDASGKTGIETVTSGVSSIDVIFGSSFDDIDYSIVTSLVNIVDANPAQYGSTISSKTVNGFTVLLSDFTDTGNYELNWAAWEEAGGGGNYDNYSGWSFAVDGVTKDTITSSGILNFVGGDNITITRSAEDEITISGGAGGGGGGIFQGDWVYYVNSTDTGAIDDMDRETPFITIQSGNILSVYNIVTVGTSVPSDYTDIRDAVKYLRPFNGGIIIVHDCVSAYSEVLDWSNITVIGSIEGTTGASSGINFLATNPGENGMYYGSNVTFINVGLQVPPFPPWANHFPFKCTGKDIYNFYNCWYHTMNFVVVNNFIDCNNKEAEINFYNFTRWHDCGVTGAPFCINDSNTHIYLSDSSTLRCETPLNVLRDAGSLILEGVPAQDTLVDKASGVVNDSAVSGTTVKDALETLDADKSEKSIVYTNTIILQAAGANYETINHALMEQFAQVTVMFKPSAGVYQDQWINGEGVLTVVYHDTNNIRLYNDSASAVAIGRAKVVIQK